MGIQVAIDPNATRNICQYIESYFSPEVIDYFCRSCQREYPAIKQIDPVAIPNVVMIHLKRFQWVNGSLRKINSLIECPLTMTFCSEDFDLVASISHVGSVTSGHYLAFGRNQGSWYELNDERVRKCNLNEIISRNTYVIFYLRKSCGSGGSG